MDRKDYDRKTLAIFDTVGSYFIDVVYNGHFLYSRDSVRQSAAKSLTDAYRDTIFNYMNGIAKRDDLYKKVVHNLHEFYQINSGFGSVVLSEFEDRILSQFIPPEYYRDFNEDRKDKTLREIIIRSVNELGEICVSRDMLRRIIDDHMNKNNVEILQDRIVDIFIVQREDYYARFAREISDRNGTNKVDKKLFDNLKAMFVAEKQRSCDLSVDKERAVSMITQLMEKIQILEAENQRLVNESRIKIMPPAPAKPTEFKQPSYIAPKYEPKYEPFVQSNAPFNTPFNTPTNAPTVFQKTPYPSPKESSPEENNSSESSEEGPDEEELNRMQKIAIGLRNTKAETLQSESQQFPQLSEYSLDDDTWINNI